VSETISNRTDKSQNFNRSFTTHSGPKGRRTLTSVQTPTFSSQRLIYPGGLGYEIINGEERPIQLTGGGQDFMESGIMNNSIVNTIKEGYQKVEPYLPDVDIGDKTINYDYERPVGPGILNFSGEYDVDDNEYGLDFGYKFSFDEGGIVDTPQAQDTIKKQLSDEQKDYLYDFMLDFMMKQKMKEQQEMEGRVPMFNYFDMEV